MNSSVFGGTLSHTAGFGRWLLVDISLRPAQQKCRYLFAPHGKYY
jgi:hypothetical protein